MAPAAVSSRMCINFRALFGIEPVAAVGAAAPVGGWLLLKEGRRWKHIPSRPCRRTATARRHWWLGCPKALCNSWRGGAPTASKAMPPPLPSARLPVMLPPYRRENISIGGGDRIENIQAAAVAAGVVVCEFAVIVTQGPPAQTPPPLAGGLVLAEHRVLFHNKVAVHVHSAAVMPFVLGTGRAGGKW